MVVCMRSARLADTALGLRKNNDTVLGETLAKAATSFMVRRLPLRLPAFA
jgi:hypothetical protein